MSRWKYRARDEGVARALAEGLGKPYKFGEFLAGRCFKSAEEVRAFVDFPIKSLPNPLSMPGMPRAVEILLGARERQALVAISGDYDVDGLTATALLTRVLGAMGFRIMSRIPNRLDEGYGLSAEAVREIHAQGASYLITVDSGVSDIEAVLEAERLGLKVIITDHHQLPPTLPDAAAIINPHLGGGWEDTLLAGVGVAFMLAWAVRNALGAEAAGVGLVEQLALVALGTVADLAPLQGPNRTMVRHGLKFLMASKWPGIVALKRVLKLDGLNRISVKDVGYRLAPRLNAAGRMGSAKPALDILLTESPYEAARLAKELEGINKVRFDTQALLVGEALEMLEHDCQASARTVVLAKEGWPKGLLGLAASRVAEKSGKPTIMFTVQDGLAVGSGRTSGDFDLFEALSRVRGHCVSMGGHSQAAGLKVAYDRLESFKEAFESASREQGWNHGENELLVDVVAGLTDLEVLRPHVAEMEPYGQGHPSPVVAVKNLTVLHAHIAKGNRLELRLSDGLSRLNVSGFNMVSRLEEVGQKADVALIYDPDGYIYGNSWRLLDFRHPRDAAN
ncbi:MAG: single-stranded-DNA-specific exonuclease RecJ [Deltaproteobacteria bacterium]|jgi:single-stranded-DNA-specific exonuclease|nr:single-stranded-DNA-specific exonuclease RecJ [Deltaproteobacteria bacterium]